MNAQGPQTTSLTTLHGLIASTAAWSWLTLELTAVLCAWHDRMGCSDDSLVTALMLAVSALALTAALVERWALRLKIMRR